MTERGEFNLLDEPWIVVLRRDGRLQEVSILELFTRATEFSAIGGEVPTQAFAITRMLLAFLHRALDGPSTQAEWADLWEAGDLPHSAIGEYSERVRSRLDLFSGDVPFMQVAGLHTAKNEVFGLERLIADVPNGEPLFTTRSSRDLQRISAAEAARWLVHVQSFDSSGIKSGAIGDPTVKNGKGYPIGPGWCGQIGGVLLQGRDLRETLLLNLIGRDAASYVTIGDEHDLPVWERDPDGPAGVQRPPRGAIDLYTWQTRRVRLFGSRFGVTGVVLANGDKIAPQNLHGLEPHTAWRHSEPQTKKFKSRVFMPRLHDPNRSVWRGIAALLPSTSGRCNAGSQQQPFLAPGVLQWIGDLNGHGLLPDGYMPGVRIFGAVYGPQQATFAEIVDDELPVPIALLREDRPAAGMAAVGAVADADAAASVLWALAQNLAQAAGADTSQTASGDTAREDLYARLESPYRVWLSDLATVSDIEQARLGWRATIRNMARSVADQLIRAAPPAAWMGREVRGRLINVALAEAWFRAALQRAAPGTTHPSNEPREETEG